MAADAQRDAHDDRLERITTTLEGPLVTAALVRPAGVAVAGRFLSDEAFVVVEPPKGEAIASFSGSRPGRPLPLADAHHRS